MTDDNFGKLVKKLKRCPICGNRPILLAYLTDPLDCWVKCEHCGAEVKRGYRGGEFWSEEKAVEEWNTRVDEVQE